MIRNGCIAAILGTIAVAGCARVQVEGGEKPIHIVMDVNLRVARELDEFFAFEQKPPTTTTAPVKTAVNQ